jgi:flagellar biosynthesis component FlhA
VQFKKLASQLNRLWNQMDTPREERNLVDDVSYTISASVDEVITPNALALDLIKQVLKDLLKFKGLGSKSYAN